MGKNYKFIIGIVFLPITIIFLFIKKIFTMISNKKINKYINSLDISNIDSLDGKELEDFLYYFFKNLKIKVSKTKVSRDYGADLIIELNKIRVVIQCKLYFKHSVGNSAIQEVSTAKEYYNADKGLVITNSYFTKSAIELSKSNNIALIDRNIFSELLSSTVAQKHLIINSLIS